MPVIITTAYPDLDSAVSAFQGGAFEHLPKPFDIDEAVDRYQKSVQGTLYRPIEAYLNLGRIFANRFELDKALVALKNAFDMKRKRDQVEFLRGLINSASVVQGVGAQTKLLTKNEIEEWYVKRPADFVAKPL